MRHGSQKYTANTKAQRFERANKNIFSRNLVLVEVSYFLGGGGGGQISRGGAYFLGNMARRGKFPRKGPNFGGGGQISCDTGHTNNRYIYYFYGSASGQRTLQYRAVKIWNSLDNDSLKMKIQSLITCLHGTGTITI